MKLTEKDRQFLQALKRLVDAKDLRIELALGSPSHMVLRGTYGERIHETFRMSRQGVRWRFWRLFNDVYVSAFEAILFIETTFGPQLREHALRISQERYAQRQQLDSAGFQSADTLTDRREAPPDEPN